MANLNSIPDLSNTASSNINYKGQSIRGTALASTIDSMFQNNASMLADFYDSLGGVATVSGTDTYTVTITEDWAALASGLILAVKIPNANTGAATLNVTVPTAGALGAKAIRRQGDSALSANDMVANGVYLLRYASSYNSSAGAWVLMNPAATSISTPVTEANGGTNQTTYTQGDILYASAANTLSKLAKGSTGQSLTQSSTIPAWGSVVVLGTPAATTSGTSVDFTGIPSWARHVMLLLSGVSVSGTSEIYVQLGTSGGVESSGYSGAVMTGASAVAHSAAFRTGSGAAANTVHGILTFELLNSSTNLWACSITFGLANSAAAYIGGGTKALSAALDRVRITTAGGTDTFDAGSANIAYW